LVRVLVTGVTGFHGYHVAMRLVEKGYNVYGLVRHTSQGKKVPDGVKIVEGDLTDPVSITEAIRRSYPSIVIHLAALTPVSKSFDQPDVYASVNYIGTVHLFEAWRRIVSREHRIGFIYASTSECYGQQRRFPITEDAELRPNTPYAVSKYAAEAYLRFYGYEELGEPVVISVPFNSYGRAYVGQRHFVIEKILSTLAEGGRRVELGDPDAIRDFLFREDVVRAYEMLVEALESKPWRVVGQRFNFCTGRGVSIAALVEIIKRVTGIDFEVEWHRHQRPADIKVLIGSYYKALRVLGWSPRYSLEDGIKRAFEEWCEVLGTKRNF
jgi:GDP-mannose 4,6-dehydratase